MQATPSGARKLFKIFITNTGSFEAIMAHNDREYFCATTSNLKGVHFALKIEGVGDPCCISLWDHFDLVGVHFFPKSLSLYRRILSAFP